MQISGLIFDSLGISSPPTNLWDMLCLRIYIYIETNVIVALYSKNGHTKRATKSHPIYGYSDR